LPRSARRPRRAPWSPRSCPPDPTAPGARRRPGISRPPPPSRPGAAAQSSSRSCLYSHQAPAWAPRARSMTTSDTGGMFSGVNSFRLMTPIRPSGMIAMSTRPDGLDHSACVNQYPAGLTVQYPRIRTSFPVLVEYSAKPNRPFQALPDSLVLTWKYTALVTITDPSGVTAGSYCVSVTWKVLPDGLYWRVVAMTRRLEAIRSPPADVRLSSRSSTGGSTPWFLGSHSNASSRPSAVQDRP